MIQQSQSQTFSSGSPINFDVKEQNFDAGQFGVPIAGKYSYPNGSEGNAIGEYSVPPSSGTYVLGSIGGVIQWIATESCE